MTDRRSDLAAAVLGVRDRIHDAARSVGRDPRSVTLVGVTKTYPAADVDLLVDLGVADVGENRVDELAGKAAETTSAPRWHFIGQLQTNKVNRLVGAEGLVAVHSVDRARLVRALSTAVTSTDAEGTRDLDCFAQVDLADPGARDLARGGVEPAELPDLAAQIASAPGLRLAGLMAVAPLGGEPAPAFERLAELAENLRRDHPGATGLSAGMSDDFEVAIRLGATHVRVGAALLGHRRLDE